MKETEKFPDFSEDKMFSFSLEFKETGKKFISWADVSFFYSLRLHLLG